MKKSKIADILKLLMLKKDVKTTQLARLADIPQQTLQRIVTETSPRPHESTLKNIADYFGISIKQLKGEEQLPKEFFPTVGFEDILVKKSIYVPLLTWDQLKELGKINKRIEKNEVSAFDNMITISLCFNEQCFGLIMNDSSMDPYFPEDSILVIDPNKDIKDRSFALVKLEEEKIFLFRQVLLDGRYKYLKPINPDLNSFKMRLLSDKDEIIGVLVEARRVYDNI